MRVCFPCLLLLAMAAPALAEEGDLKQTSSDLSGQVDDKERLDTQGAVKIEISHARAWLSEAANAIKEDKGELTRKLFDRVRSQLKLMDQRIALSQLQAELRKLEQALASARKALDSAKKQLEEKRVQLKAMQMTQKK